MDFFAQQERARKQTRRLVALFILAVLATAAVTGLVASGFYAFLGDPQEHWALADAGLAGWWHSHVVAIAAVATMLVILCASATKTMQLSSGGGVVARDLGGRRVDPGTTDTDELRLRNVVEEMAIASGIPVPDVYVLEREPSINAFAAGWSTGDAVVAVSRGALDHLTRDELQGVVGHEFSHILNGDMRLNMRLIGLVFGLVAIVVLGRVLLNSLRFVRPRGREGGGAVVVILAAGVALMVVGSVGALAGRLLRSAISRQREFLADAAAVEFTRNPDGIAGALKKIGAPSARGRMEAARAAEAAHLFFADGLGRWMSGSFMATHPPLEARIRAIDPSWDGKFPKLPVHADDAERSAYLDSLREGGEPRPRGFVGPAASLAQPTLAHLVTAREIRGHLPASLAGLEESKTGAQAIVFGLLLSQDGPVRAAELETLRAALGDGALFQRAVQVGGLAGGLHSSEKLALVDLAVPTLRRLGGIDRYRRFSALVAALMEADGATSLFEYTMGKVVRRHLDLFYGLADLPKMRFRTLQSVADPVRDLLLVLARLAGDPGWETAYRAALAELEPELGPPQPHPRADQPTDIAVVEEALGALEASTPPVRKRFLMAAAQAVVADGIVISAEAELLRAFADAIGSPVPPFVENTRRRQP